MPKIDELRGQELPYAVVCARRGIQYNGLTAAQCRCGMRLQNFPSQHKDLSVYWCFVEGWGATCDV